MSPIYLRAATRQDREAVTRLVYRVLEEYGLAADPAGADADLAALPDFYTEAGGYFGVLPDASGELIGTIGLLPRVPGRIELRKMYFLPRLRGQGVGKAVLDWAIRRAAADGYEAIELETARALVEAVGLYRSFGFRDDVDGPDTGRCDYRFILPTADYSPPEGLRPVTTEPVP